MYTIQIGLIIVWNLNSTTIKHKLSDIEQLIFHNIDINVTRAIREFTTYGYGVTLQYGLVCV